MKNRLLVGCLIVSFLFCCNIYAQTNEMVKQKPQRAISIIKVKGNKAISSTTILSKIKSKPGDTFSQELLNADLKRLFSLGFFTDISIEVDDYEVGITVTFVVIEKPLVSEIIFSGNKVLRDAKLKKEIKTTENEMLDESRLNRDIEELKTLYRTKGYHLVGINYRLEEDKEENTVKVIVAINEKTKVKIKNIVFVGNNNLASKNLQKVMATRPDSLFTSGYFKEDVFETDLEKIRALYETHGFLDVVIDHSVEYDKEKRRMDLTITVDEGKKYIVGDILISGNYVFSDSDIKSKLKLVSDETFSQIALREDVLSVQQFYYQKGYMLADVDGSSTLNPASGKIDISYKVNENELVYIDKIIIKGNSKTRDIVIRRELRAYPGDRFDGDKLRRSKERLYNLGFFEEVTLDTESGSSPNKQNLVVTVKETKTGEFSFGGGFSSIEKMVGFISVTQKNFDLLNFPTFTGDGQQLKLSGHFGTIRKNYELSWTEPWIFDFPLLFGFDLYQRARSRETGLGYGYNEERNGGDIRFGKEFTDYFRGDLMYIMEEVNISNISEDASGDLKEEEGENNLRKMVLALAYDTRDNIFSPKRGYLITNSFEGAGGYFGGDKDFTKYIGATAVYFNPIKKHVLEFRGRVGVADAFDDSTKVPVYERFYAGGATTIRGYRERRIGPKDQVSNDPIGGEALIIGNVEYTFPLYEKVLKGAVFYDVGNVWANREDITSGDFKSGIGVGVRVSTPIGPVRLDFGYPLSDVEGEEQKGRFHFMLSQGF